MAKMKNEAEVMPKDSVLVIRVQFKIPLTRTQWNRIRVKSEEILRLDLPSATIYTCPIFTPDRTILVVDYWVYNEIHYSLEGIAYMIGKSVV
jgi:hypothetical protein